MNIKRYLHQKLIYYILIILLIILMIISSCFLYFNSLIATNVENNEEIIVIDQIEDNKVSLDTLIKDYCDNNNININNISYVYTCNDEEYKLNENISWFAASTYKLSLNMLYVDLINQGSLSLEDSIYFDPSYQQGDSDGYIYYNYKPGSQVPLKELMQESIINSDNLSSHILVGNLGGWNRYKQDIKKYGDNDIICNENYTTSIFQSQVINYLVAHQDEYSYLLELLGQATPSSYTITNLDQDICYHKYGLYDEYMNDVTYIKSDNPYTFCLYTKNIEDESVLADIGEIVYNYNTNNI